MPKFITILLIVFFSGIQLMFAQEKKSNGLVILDTVAQSNKYSDPLRPAKAAFYSAVLPGLGQAYNKKYWKIPVVYAGIGAGIYFYLNNNKLYNDYRDAYKSRLAGYTNDQFWGQYNNSTLVNAQKTMQRNKNLSLVLAFGMYVLNIVDANVDAHLMQFNVDNRLSIKPDIHQNPTDYRQNLGFTLNYNF